MIPYITYSDMVTDIANNIHKIPHDIDGVIAIPRSGLMPGSVISNILNLPITTVDVFSNTLDFNSAFLGKGVRKIRSNNTHKFIVVDDTIFNGTAMAKAAETLEHSALGAMCEFEYWCVYCEKPQMLDKYPVKHCIKDVSDIWEQSSMKVILYEWNRFHHYPVIASRMLYDLDGVLVMDPPADTNTELYEAYIKNPIPKYIPTSPISICTFRLTKYKDVTIQSLKDLGVEVASLCMFDGTYEQRSRVSPSVYKASFYKDSPFVLFVESNDEQARLINKLSGKPVMSVEKNCVYN